MTLLLLTVIRTTREEQAVKRARLAEQRRQQAEYSERVKHAEFLTTHGLLAEMGNGVESDWDPERQESAAVESTQSTGPLAAGLTNRAPVQPS